MIDNAATRRKILEQIEGELEDRPVPRSKKLLETLLGRRDSAARPLRDLLLFDLTSTLKMVNRGVQAYRAGRRRRRVRREARRARRLLALIGKIHDERRQGGQAHYRQSSAGPSLVSASPEVTFLFFEARSVQLIRYSITAARELEPQRTFHGVFLAAVSDARAVRLAHLWNLEETLALEAVASEMQAALERCFPYKHAVQDWRWKRGAFETLTRS